MAAPKMYQATDTFSAELEDGSSLHVAKGSVFHGGHELVKRDAGRGLLFRPLEDAEPAPKSAAKASGEGS